MKPIYLTILLSLCAIQLSAQQLTTDYMVGTWKVVNAEVAPGMDKQLDAEGKKKMELMRKGLVNTQFTFSDTKKFTLVLPATCSDFMQELQFLNNKNWLIKDKGAVVIGTDKEGYNLMKILVREKEKKTYFLLDDSPFTLEVIKL